MKSIVFIVGARPNFVKIAPVLRAARTQKCSFSALLVHTGQHYSEQMTDVFFTQLGIPTPEVNLGVGSGPHGAQTARILEAFERYLLDSDPRPSGVVVVGDVNSTVACALAAAKIGIPVAHLEAGLRSFDRSMPEEINRIVTDSISDLLLVSEPHGEENLLREGVPAERIRFVGNVMIDSLTYNIAAARGLGMPARYGLNRGEYVMMTLHRPSNVDDPARLAEIVTLILEISTQRPVVFPVHPRCHIRLAEGGLLGVLQKTDRIIMLEPLPYIENLSFLEGAKLVLTDSGGIQEETSFLGIPCITLRENTERPITVTRGTNTVVGSDFDLVHLLVRDCMAGHTKQGGSIPGWDGCAAQRVIEALENCSSFACPSRGVDISRDLGVAETCILRNLADQCKPGVSSLVSAGNRGQTT